MHVFLPPHPGPVAATEFVEANLGYVLAARPPGRVPDLVGLRPSLGQGRRQALLRGRPGCSVRRADRRGGGDRESPGTGDRGVPPALLPLFLILLNTGLDALGTAGVVDAEAGWVEALRMLGQTPVALLIAVIATTALLGFRRGKSGTAIERTLDNALGPVCSVILITGAGGMFGGVLRATGIGDAIADSLSALGIPLILAAYIIAAAIRVAQGSATVALTTAAALVAPGVLASDLSQPQVACIVLALAAGSVLAGHVNDSGFWLVSRLLRMDVKTTLRTWTVQQTIESLTGFVLVLVIYGIVSLV
ncbi:GntP family permease [Brachybacterium sp. GPGPB12]|uniref:GntP family permease n=1 Tax=Brachybacterium sp. GPGPB12 TaxID=3023517 RepID=UPI0031342507